MTEAIKDTLPLLIRKEPIGYITFDPEAESILRLEVDNANELQQWLRNIPHRFSDNTNTVHPELGAPLSLTIYPSFLCNHKCNFCYLNRSELTSPQVMSMQTLDSILQYVFRRVVFSIDILGGEPFLKRTLPTVRRLTLECLSAGVKVYISTNGSQDYPELWDFLETIGDYYPNFEIGVSLHGPIDIHDSLTNSRSYNDVMSFIRRLETIGVPYGVNTVVVGGNLELLRRFHSEVITTLSKRRHWLLLYPTSVAGSIKSLGGIPPVANVLTEVEKIKKQDTRITMNMPFSYKYFNTAIPSDAYERLQVGCSAGRTKLSILPNGQTSLCCFLRHNHNFTAEGIQHTDDLWNNEVQDRSKFKVIPKNYTRCQYFEICDGCLAHCLSTGAHLDTRCPSLNCWDSSS